MADTYYELVVWGVLIGGHQWDDPSPASEIGMKKIVVTSSTMALSHPNNVWINQVYGGQGEAFYCVVSLLPKSDCSSSCVLCFL